MPQCVKEIVHGLICFGKTNGAVRHGLRWRVKGGEWRVESGELRVPAKIPLVCLRQVSLLTRHSCPRSTLSTQFERTQNKKCEGFPRT